MEPTDYNKSLASPVDEGGADDEALRRAPEVVEGIAGHQRQQRSVRRGQRPRVGLFDDLD